MGIARKVTKQDFELLYDLIFNSYTTCDFELIGLHFTLRSLTTQERDAIFRKFKFLSNKHNMRLVLEILSFSVFYIDGHKFEYEKHRRFLYKFNSKLILKLYFEFQKLEESIAESSKFIDYYLESRESRNMWSVFKTCSRVKDAFDIRKFNQYQFYWIVSNVYKDSLNEEKKVWSKVEYMTNSICAFLNPKAFRKAKSQMSIVEQLEQQEDKEKQRIVDELERGKVVETVKSNDVFSSMERQANETDEEYEYRINTLMEKTLKGELVDEHDRLVREDEIKFLKKFLREKRLQVLIEREKQERSPYRFDSSEVLENEASKIQFEEDKKLGFFHDNFSYIEIINMKDFVTLSREEKQKVFDEVMNEDISKEVDSFLKSLSEEESRISSEVDKPITISDKLENASEGEADIKNVLRTTAEKASNMSVNIKNVDLLEQHQEKIRNAIKAINRRNVPNLEQETDLDVMKFD